MLSSQVATFFMELQRSSPVVKKESNAETRQGRSAVLDAVLTEESREALTISKTIKTSYVSVKSYSDRVVIKEKINYTGNITNHKNARAFIAEFEKNKGIDDIKIGKRVSWARRGESLPLRHFFRTLSNFISCCIICNELEKAKIYIDFAFNIVADKKIAQCGYVAIGDCYFQKFYLLLKEIKHEEVKMKLSPERLKIETQGAGLDQELTKALRRREVVYNLGMAVKYGHEVAKLAVAIYNMDPTTDEFPVLPGRAFAIIDAIIQDAQKQDKQGSSEAEQAKYGMSLSYCLIKTMINIIEELKQKIPDPIEVFDASSDYLISQINRMVSAVLGVTGFQDYLSQKNDNFFLALMGWRDILLRQIRVIVPMYLYVLSKIDEKNFNYCIRAAKSLFGSEGGRAVVFPYLGSRKEYREHTFIYNTNDRPKDGNDVCVDDPQLWRSTIDHIFITHLVSQLKSNQYLMARPEWDMIEASFKEIVTKTNGEVPFYIRTQYKDIQIKRKNYVEALLQLQILEDEYAHRAMNHEHLITLFEIEQLENMGDIISLQLDSMTKQKTDTTEENEALIEEAVSPDTREENEKGEDEVEDCSENAPHEATPTVPDTAETARSCLQVMPQPQAADPWLTYCAPDINLPTLPVRQVTTTAFDYAKVCQQVQDAMEYDTLEKVTAIINTVLEGVNLSHVDRGRLLWRKGWAYKALARDKKERRNAIDLFKRGLGYAIPQENYKKSKKRIDPIQLLSDSSINQYIYHQSYKEPHISLIADLFSACGNYFRDMQRADLGRLCSDFSDKIKPWRRLRKLPSRTTQSPFEPKIKIIKSK